MVQRPFEIIEHPADVGFVACGATREELFANAALALMTLACSPQHIAERERRDIAVAAADLESLLYAWLAEILAMADAEQLFFRRAEVHSIESQPQGLALRGAAFGETYDKQRHAASTYIKAVTYHQLKVEQAPDGWRAQVYLDV
jgi:SHS2 domain-containing protein